MQGENYCYAYEICMQNGFKYIRKSRALEKFSWTAIVSGQDNFSALGSIK